MVPNLSHSSAPQSITAMSTGYTPLTQHKYGIDGVTEVANLGCWIHFWGPSGILTLKIQHHTLDT